MRMLFSVLGLLVVAAIVGLLARQSLTLSPAASAVQPPGAAAPPAAPQQVEQVRQALDLQMQQARPMPDDTR